MTVLVKIAFDGTNYHGFQIQDNALSVFAVFQQALIKVLGYQTDIKGCSRTDSGVHASCYYLSFELKEPMDLRKLPLSLNANLPLDIRAIDAHQVRDGFHARYDAKAKEYTYNILNSHVDSPFFGRYYYRVPSALDVAQMNRAAQFFVGTHDFESFMTRKSKIVDCTRRVYYAKVEQKGEMISFVVNADGYLYNMVRIMVGTLIKVGRGQLLPKDIEGIILSKNRDMAGVTVPPQGLFLTGVTY